MQQKYSFFEKLSPLFENSGCTLGRVDVLAGTPRTTQPSCPILKNENITGRDLPPTVEYLNRTSDMMVTGHQ